MNSPFFEVLEAVLSLQTPVLLLSHLEIVHKVEFVDGDHQRPNLLEGHSAAQGLLGEPNHVLVLLLGQSYRFEAR